MAGLFLEADDILVPIRIDLTHKGAHYIDSFTWNLYNSLCSVEEFVMRICCDYNFPVTFIPLISYQMQQQIDSYFILFSLLYNQSSQQILSQLSSMIVELNIRQNVLEYSDTFQWDPNSLSCNPEKFAQITCGDLGLPPEMEPSIAFDIRESIIRFCLPSLFCPSSLLHLSSSQPDNSSRPLMTHTLQVPLSESLTSSPH
jgi:hypothetical protein